MVFLLSGHQYLSTVNDIKHLSDFFMYVFVHEKIISLYKNVHEMINSKRDKDYNVLLELWVKANNESKLVPTSTEVFKGGIYKKISTDKKTAMVPTDFVMLEPKFMKGLTKGERDIVIQIVSELKMYNALWYSNYRDKGGRFEKKIGLLRNRGILIKTSNNEIHIVNPWIIRRGEIKRVIVATNKLLENEKPIDKKMIINLIPPAEARISSYFASLNVFNID